MSAVLNLQRVLKPKFELRIVDRQAELRVWYNNEWRLPGTREFSNASSTSTFTDNRAFVYHGTDEDDHSIALASYWPPNFVDGHIFGFVRIVENRTSMIRVHMFIRNGNIMTNADWYANTSVILGVPADLDWSALISDHTVTGHIDNDLWRWRSGQPITLPKEWTDSTTRWRYIRERADRNRAAIQRRTGETKVLCRPITQWGLPTEPTPIRIPPQIEFQPRPAVTLGPHQESATQATIEELEPSENESEPSVSRTLGTLDSIEQTDSDDSSYVRSPINISPDLISRLELQYGTPAKPVANSTLAEVETSANTSEVIEPVEPTEVKSAVESNDPSEASEQSAVDEQSETEEPKLDEARANLRRQTHQVLRRINRLRIHSLKSHRHVFQRK